MRLKKLLIAVLFTLSFSLTCFANEYTDGCFTYITNGDFAEITSCKNIYVHKIVIPETIDGYTVKGIASGAFYGNENLTEVCISDGIKSVGDFSFYMCEKLQKIVLPESVIEIGENAFAGCEKLRKITLSQNVEKIGENAFLSCESISVSDKNKNYSSDENGVLFNKHKSILLQYPSNSGNKEYRIPKSAKRIGKRAFYKALNLKSVDFHDEMTVIEDEAFSESGINSAHLPDSIKKLGTGVFSKSLVKTVKLSKEQSVISDRLFYMCLNLETVYGADKIKEIGSEAFFGCEKLNAFKIPQTVQSIGKGAYLLCKSLKNIVIPFGVESIKENTFYSCGLCTVTIPSSVKSIGFDAFSECKSLQKVFFEGSEELWNEVFVDRNNSIEKNVVFQNHDINLSIKTPKRNKVRYGETLILHIDCKNLPEGYVPVWSVGGDCAEITPGEDGTCCYVIPKKSGKCTVAVNVCDKKAEITVKVRVNFWWKGVSYIKNLFGLTRDIV